MPLSSVKPTSGLEVKANNQLDQASTWIVGGGTVLIGVTNDATQGSSVKIVRRVSDQEVDVVEGVQELASQLKVRSFRELHLLDETNVSSEE